MSAVRAASNGRPLGSNSLPTGVKSDAKLLAKTVAVQIPRRPLGTSAEENVKNAESDQWFDEANRRVTAQLDGLEDDAPFFLPDTGAVLSGDNHSSSVPLDDPILSYMRTNDSERENEELRGIIDDLTLDIKRLKRKIRRYKERDPPHLRGNKLFDVRTHGLSSRKKRHLERILQRFADDISTSPTFSKNRRNPKKTKHTVDATGLPDDDARMALVAILFEHFMCHSSINNQYLSNAKLPPSDSCGESWHDVSEMLNTIKQLTTSADVEFSCRALKRYSTSLELSADSRCVRWQTNENRDGSTHPSATPNSKQKHLSAQHKSKPTHRRKPPSYVPYTFTTRNSDAGDDVVSMISSGSELTALSDAGGCASHSQPEVQARPSHASQGRVTYYKDTAFYIDYSGDNLGLAESLKEKGPLHRKGTEKKRKRQGSPGLVHEEHRRRKPVSKIADRFLCYPDEKDLPVNLSQCSSPVVSLAENPLTSVKDGHKAFPTKLEASGVGGVVPSDNFAIHVMMEHAPVSAGDEISSGNKIKAEDPPMNNTIICNSQLHRRSKDRSKNAFKTNVISSTHERLSPSPLPPATCGFFSSTSSDEDGDDDFEEKYNEERLEEDVVVSHDAFRNGLRQVILDEGESPTSMDSIEKWSAQVVASLENDESGYSESLDGTDSGEE